MFITRRIRCHPPAVRRTFSHKEYPQYDPLLDYTSTLSEKKILLVGDGDLSNGAAMALKIKETRQDVEIVSSVLESEGTHNDVFKNSLQNIDIIREHGHEVKFEVDATRLEDHFEHESMDRIQWNFPHWKGKTNNRRNRTLISDFFTSSSDLLLDGGQIHLALMNHQGGMMAKTNSEWKQSWLPAIYAGDNGLLLSHILPYQPAYNLSAYKFQDRPFYAEKKASMHLFTKSQDRQCKAPEDTQMFSYFTLFMALPVPANIAATTLVQSDQLWRNEQILDDQFVLAMIKDKVPDGIRIRIKPWRILRQKNQDDEYHRAGEWKVMEYQVVLFGESIPITLKDTESYKKAIEDEIQHRTRGTKRGGWNASHIVPSSLLETRKW